MVKQARNHIKPFICTNKKYEHRSQFAVGFNPWFGGCIVSYAARIDTVI